MHTAQSAMLGQMDVKKVLFKLAIPATIAMIANALYNLVDTLFLAWGVGEIAIGALTIVLPFQTLIFALGLMFGMGSSSIFSRAFGRGDKAAMKRAVNSALFFNGLFAAILTVVSLIYMDEILYIFGASEVNIEYAKDYMFWIVLSLVPFTSALVLNNLARAEGRANISMISLLIGSLLNVFLDPLFIFEWGLGLGVSGAAIATFIAKVAMFTYVLIASLSPKSALMIDKSSLYQFDLPMLKETIVIGLPTFIRNGLMAFVVIAINHLVNQYAPTDPGLYIAVFGVVNRLSAFLLLPGFGLVQGMIPIVGFNYGAGKYHRLRDTIIITTRYLMIYFFIAAAIMFIFARPLIMIFSKNSDPLFISIGMDAFKIIPIGFLILAYQFIMSSVYQALGYPIRAFIIALSRQLLIFLPVVYILTPIFGIMGIWMTFAISDGLSGFISWIAYRYEIRSFSGKPSTDDHQLLTDAA
jgi:putative MATE family efflux protein